jgi:hypothetical protein
MATLTSRTLATGVTLSDLIHIVITGDTSQNPEGSSYKATIGQVLDLFSASTNTYVTGGTYDNNTGTATFTNNQGGEFDVTGFYTGGTDIYVTGGTYDNNTGTATFTNNQGSEFDVTGFYTGDTYTTSGITTSSSTLDINYTYYGVNYSGDVDLTLPDATGLDGNFLIIKDEGGNSGTYRIRLLSSLNLIDGNSFVDMNTNFMSLTIIARNNNWWII